MSMLTLSRVGNRKNCRLEDGVAIAPSTALRLSCDAALVPLIEDSEGNPLSVGRRTRSISLLFASASVALARQRLSLSGVQPHCFLAGHHVHHWAHGGETKIDNLLELCPFHHRLVHEGGYTVQITSAGFEFFDTYGDAVPNTPDSDRVFSCTAPKPVKPTAICSQWAGDALSLEWAIYSLMHPPKGPPPEIS